MKSKLARRIAVLMFVLFGAVLISSAQSPPPPGGGTGSAGHDPIGGNAPVGEGLFVLISTALLYGARSYQKKVSSELKK